MTLPHLKQARELRLLELSSFWSYATVESVSWPHMTRRDRRTPGSCKSPATLELRNGQAELIVCRANPVALFRQETWGAGQLELRQQINRFTGFGAASPTTPGQGN